MPDANKTKLTRQITQAAATWLDQRGFRPVETEVQVAEGWVADLAGFCYPTRTEAQALKLIGQKPDWHWYKHRDLTEEFYAILELWESAYVALPSPITAIIEVKASIADFARDTKWNAIAPAHLLYVAAPSNLIQLDALNLHWGVLSLTKGGDVRLVRAPRVNPVNTEQTLGLVCQIAMRRDNFTRAERLREFDKQAREDDNARINRDRLSSLMSAVLAIVKGDSVQESLRSHCGNTALPDWQIRQLEEMASKARKGLPCPR